MPRAPLMAGFDGMFGGSDNLALISTSDLLALRAQVYIELDKSYDVVSGPMGWKAKTKDYDEHRTI